MGLPESGLEETATHPTEMVRLWHEFLWHAVRLNQIKAVDPQREIHLERNYQMRDVRYYTEKG